MKNDLEIALDNLAFWSEEKLEPIVLSLLEGKLDGQAMLELCQLHRRMAIGRLLSALDIDGFHRGLRQSAQAYLFLLQQSRRGFKVDPYYVCTSRAEPFWDAVASEDRQAAARIAELTPRSWRAGMEDEGDFRYMNWLMALSYGSESEASLEEALAMLERACLPSESTRVELCTALLHKDATAMSRALGEQMDAHRDSFEALANTDSLSPEAALTEAFVSIEGLALLKLAGQRGMQVVPPTHGVPDIALMSPSTSLQMDDPWSILKEGLPTPE